MIAEVKDIDAYDPDGKNPKPRRPAFNQIELKPDGTTDQAIWMWSGKHLMDLDKYQALRMVTKSIDGKEHLFVEAGGFSTRNKPDWKSTWYVLVP